MIIFSDKAVRWYGMRQREEVRWQIAVPVDRIRGNDENYHGFFAYKNLEKVTVAENNAADAE